MEQGDTEYWHHGGRGEGLEPMPQSVHLCLYSALKMRLPSPWLAPHPLLSCLEEALLCSHSG